MTPEDRVKRTDMEILMEQERAGTNPLRLKAAKRSFVQVSVSKDEQAAFRSAADRCGLSISAWMRMILRERLGLK